MKHIRLFSTVSERTSVVNDHPYDNILSYTKENDGLLISQSIPNNEIWYTSSDGNVVTPNSSDGFGANIVSNTYANSKGVIKFDGPVTNIGEYTFDSCSDLTSVIIPDGVTSIGDSAFCYCTSLTSVTIPDGVVNIGQGAFYDCTGLITVTIPDGMTTIGEDAFYNVLNINYNGTATGSPWGARCINGYVEDGLVYTDNTKTILVAADKNITGSVTIPNSVTTIGDYAFFQCIGITSVTIPDGVTSIGGDAFSECTSLTSVTIPDGVVSIGYGAFLYCTSLTSVTIPDSMTSIGDSVFEECESLASVDIPDSVVNIGQGAFYDCTGLITVTIPDGVTTIGEDAFYNVLNINYNGTATGSPWGARCINGYVEDGLVYTDNTKTILVGAPSTITGNVVIPNTVTSIGQGAFSGCSSLTSVTIPNTVTSISRYVFNGCRSLTSVTIPNTVTSIGSYAFYYCIGLTSITCDATTPPTLSNIDAFSNTNNCPIYVPAASVNTYKAANNWNRLASRIQAIQS